MSNPVLKALKTGRQLAATAGLVVGAFGLPALMAGGVVLPDLMPTAADVEWMGTGDEDPVVYLGVDEPGPSGTDAVDQTAANPAPAGSDTPEPAQQATQKADVLQVETRDRTPRKTAGNRSAVRDAINTESVDNAAGPREATGFIARVKAQREAAAKSRAKARGKRCREPMDGIEHLYGDRYKVERHLIERYSKVEEAVKLARVGWHKDASGRVDGFKLYRVACGSPLAQVGLRSGDVIHTINGRKVRTLPQAFTAVRKVKRHDAIRVEFSRGGLIMSRMVTVE